MFIQKIILQSIINNNYQYICPNTNNNIILQKNTILLFLLALVSLNTKANYDIYLSKNDTIVEDSLSKFDRINKKAEKLFKILPFPMVSYSTETGTLFGLAKYNLIKLVKGDTISTVSSFNELVSISTEGQFKIVFGSNLYLLQNKLVLQGGVEYVEFPQYILGVGNDVKREDVERINTKRIAFNNKILYAINDSKTLYAGVIQEYKNYLKVESLMEKLNRQSFLDSTKYPGYDGGVSSGIGIAVRFDTRDHKYTPTKGIYLASSIINFGNYINSKFNYTSFQLDIRKYFNPWYNHVIAFQFYTMQNTGTVPFYSLGKLGGTNRMRGYYLGAIRDKTLADFQIEYRMPVWSIFGITAFAGAGRVAEKYSEMSFSDLWYSAGFGLRIMVDSENKANLRIDFGYGEEKARAVVIGFTEAF